MQWQVLWEQKVLRQPLDIGLVALARHAKTKTDLSKLDMTCLHVSVMLKAVDKLCMYVSCVKIFVIQQYDLHIQALCAVSFNTKSPESMLHTSTVL